MEDVFQFADELGPAKVIHVHEPRLGLRGILVVDNVATGPSIGGLRIAPDVSAAECFRLARAMTLKNAAAGLRHGGGKSVLFGDPRMPRLKKEQLIRAFACALKNETDYIFGPDMGSDEECMAWVKDEIGRSVGLPKELGGIPLDEIGATGWGFPMSPMSPCVIAISSSRAHAWRSRGSVRWARTSRVFWPRRERCWWPQPIPRARSPVLKASTWRSCLR